MGKKKDVQSKFPFIVLMVLLLVLQLGCTEDEATPASIDLGRFNQVCKLDTRAFNKIFDRNIAMDINCLGENLKEFSNMVRTQKPGVITLEELLQFVKKFYPHINGEQLTVVSFLFKVNSVLLREEEEHMSVAKVDMLVEILKSINYYGVQIKDLTADLDTEKYHLVRRHLINTIEQASAELVTPLGRLGGKKHSFTLWGILHEIKTVFNVDALDPARIECYFFVKKLVLGGETNKIDNKEFLDLLSKAPSFITLYLDINHFGFDDFLGDRDIQKTYMDHLSKFEDILYPHDPDQVIVSHNGLSEALYKLLRKKYSRISLDQLILNFKKFVVGGEEDRFRYRDIQIMIRKAHFYLESIYFNTVTWEHFTDKMESRLPIDDLPFPDLPEYRDIRSSSVVSLWTSFHSIATESRFFLNHKNRITFNQLHLRSLLGFQVLSLFENVLEWIIESFGSPRDDGIFEMSKDQLKQAVYSFKLILLEVGILPPYVDKTINEIFLNSDLFHRHSDGNEHITAKELTEAGVMIYASGKIIKDLSHQLLKICQDQDEDLDEISFDAECFRDNFMPMMLIFSDGKDHYPNLFREWEAWDEEMRREHLINLEVGARLDKNMDRPITKREVGRLQTSLSYTESIYVLYDVNRDNKLNRNELDAYFEVVKATLSRKADLPIGGEDLLKSLFLYMVKKKKVPGAVSLISFHLFANKKKIAANRDSIAAIFAEIAR